MTCEIKIYKKPRGNWRPKVEIKLNIKASDYLHRPKVNISLIAACYCCSICNNRQDFSSYTMEKGDFILPDSTAFFSSPKHNNKGEEACEKFCEQGKRFRYKTLFHGYIDADLEKQFSFYLPFRHGAKPSYSDFAEFFQKVIEDIQEQLKDGLDLGESDEIIITQTQPYKKEVKPTRKLNNNKGETYEKQSISA